MNKIRETLHEYADHAPSAAGLLDAVRVRSRRRNRRRYATVAGLTVLVTAGGAVGGPAAWHAAFPAPAASAPALVHGDYRVTPFPYTPQWTPPGLGQPYAGSSEAGFWLSYPRIGPGQPPLMLSVDRAEPTWVSRKLSVTSSEETTVQGHPAILRYADSGGEPMVALTWQDDQGHWVTAIAPTARVDRAGIERFARELTVRPFAIKAPFSFEVLPAGAEVVTVQQNLMVLSFGRRANLVASLERAEHHSGAERSTVNGRDAELVRLPESWVLYLFDGDRMVNLSMPSLSKAELMEIANGLTITAAAALAN